MKKTIYLVVFNLWFGGVLSAQVNPQNGSIKGTITGATGQETLPGVNIVIEKMGKGVVTEDDGGFMISDLPAGNYDLTLSYVGYAKKQIKELNVKAGEMVDLGRIQMEEESYSLSQVTVTPGRFSIMGSAPLSRQVLAGKDLKNMSWAEDITRSVARLPGVSSNDFSSKFTVRGGEADEVLINLDGMELYEPFHQRDFAGGLFSIVDIETIQDIELLTGGFGADYGNRLSGVFNMRTKNIPDNQKHTSFGLSVMNARLYTDGKFADNKGTYIFSARRGMLDLIFKATGADENLPIFYDGMAKVSYDLNEKHNLSVQVLQSGDRTEVRDFKTLENRDSNDTEYNNTYAWLNLKSFYQENLFSQTLLYAGFITHNRNGFFAKNDFTAKGDFRLTDKRDYNFFGIKQDWGWDVSKKYFIKAGFDVRQLNADYSYDFSLKEWRPDVNEQLFFFENAINIKTKPSGQQFNVFLSNRFQVAPKLIMEAGLRYDYASFTDDNLVSPRVSMSYAFGKNTFLRGAWGYFYQTQFINNLDVNHNGTEFDPAELAIHYVLGFEHLFSNGINFRIEGYYKDLSNISPSFQNLRDPWEVFPESRDDVVKVDINGGTSRGIEVFLKYDMSKKVSWWFSYALAKAEDDVESVTFDGLLIKRTGNIPRLADQRHTIYVDVNYRPDDKWHFNLSWQFYHGWRRTNYHYNFQTIPDGSLHFYPVYDEFRSTLYPAYHRMDLRVNRHFKARKGKITTFVHLINLYNHANLRKFDLDVVDDNEMIVPDGNGGYETFRDDKNWFGFTPVFGASWEF